MRRWLRIPQTPLGRIALVLPFAGGVAALLYWRGPDWQAVGDAFTYVRWDLVAAAVGWNLLSVIVRSIAWRTVIEQAIPPPHPPFSLVFSAFSVGLFANVVLPGRVGELVRITVLQRRLPPREGLWARLLGTVVAHRMFDLVPAVLLIMYVLAYAQLPAWASRSLPIVVGVGVVLFVLALLVAHRGRFNIDGANRLRRILENMRAGLAIMRAPVPAMIAIFFQCLGWLCQFFAVWTTMRAFHLHLGFAAAGLVLVLMNVATILPLWPGNVGLLQAAIALPLAHYYGVAYSRGFAFAIGLQAIEASVGIGVGLVFLAREGLSFAMLRGMGSEPVPEEDREAAPSPPRRERVAG